jgi:hypothetical protein
MRLMSNALLVVMAIGLAVIAILVGRFMILELPTKHLLHRTGRVVPRADRKEVGR